MAELRYGWLSESRRAALRALVAGEVVHWSQDWCIRHVAAQIDVQPADMDAIFGVDHVLRGCQGLVGKLALVMEEQSEQRWGKQLADITEGADSAMTARIGHESFVDLVDRLLLRAGAREPVALAELAADATLTSERFGAYALTIEVGGETWGMLMDRGLADRLAPAATIAPAKLVSRQAAIGSAYATVDAVMAFGSISIAGLAGLRVGEVLVGDRGLDESVQVRVGPHGTVATGFLQRREEQLAVTFDGTSREE
ncbi:hypothetical protein DVT68_00135 [Dyella solisilvae]|uniref:Flagellar motor switch protein FliN-like C-terminal domain-containing protein n=1 Tax=Dyella solisilvae TaxID=1920168 RepID=A0A370K9K0_9GAMM|nr:hypothetical protein [Dyella solisilvae]RDI99312.1 hypothetical protein DVT68_00135 [Dyella solisilvae]